MAEATEAPAAVMVADEPAPVSEDGAETTTTPRRRGTRGGRGRRGAGATTDETSEATAEPQPAVEEPASGLPDPVYSPAGQMGYAEGEALLLPNQNQISGAARRTRGRRGGGRGGIGTPAGAPETVAPRPERPPLRDRPERPPFNDRPPRDRQDRPDRPPQDRGPRRDGPPGTVEALFARQNVLFENFANQQEQSLREMQRVVGNLQRGGGGSGGSGVALPKVAIFLDVPNLIYAAEQIGARVHFGKLLNYLTDGRQLVRATAYAPVTDDPTTRYEAQRFVQPVLNNGYKIVTKPWKRFADGSMKANFDIELAVDILTMSDRLDIVILMSGDGDFRRVCELVESKGVRVEVVAFAASTAMELRSVADQYIDLGQIMHLVGA